MNYSNKNVKKTRENLTSKKRKRRGKTKSVVLKVILGFFVVSIIAVGLSGYIVLRDVIASTKVITEEDIKPKTYTTFVKDKDGNVIEQLTGEGANRIWIDLSDIPLDTQHAFVAIEDSRFYKHHGIDPKGILRAFVVGIKNKGEFTEGASTITQQTLKNNVFDFMDEDSFQDRLTRKIKEMYLAIKIEKNITKDDILESYLNTINLGQNCLGIKSAANRYFNKEVSDLTLSESAVIAGITKNPSKYNPVTNPDDNAQRRNKVLHDMLAQKYITQEQYDEAMADDVYSRIQTVNASLPSKDDVNSYFVDTLIEQVANDLIEQKGYTQTQAYNLIYTGGLEIISTQDIKMQAICDEEMNNPDNYPSSTRYELSYAATVTKPNGEIQPHDNNDMLLYLKSVNGESFDSLMFNSQEEAMQALESFKTAFLQEGDTYDEIITLIPQPQASFVLMDHKTGKVKALVGGRGDKNASLTLNRASDTVRQPGSCFKVLSTYAPAIDTNKYTLATTIVDEPYKYADGTPVKNWYNDYRGAVSVRKAIEQSMNICAVKTLTDITPEVGFKYLEKFGFSTLDKEKDAYQALALGGISAGVTNLQLTAAFGTIANYGTYIRPKFYTVVKDHDGKVLIETEDRTREVLRPSTACLLTDAMRDVVRSGTGTTASIGEMPVSGKTGTSTNADNDTVDLWFGGYTPYYVGGVWGGNDDSKAMADGVWHEALWSKIMKRAHENLKVKEFDYKSLIEKKPLCSYKGFLPSSSCPTVTEWFAKDCTKKCDGKHSGFSSYIEEEKKKKEEEEKKKKEEEEKKKASQSKNPEQESVVIGGDTSDDTDTEGGGSQEGDNPTDPGGTTPEVTPTP